MTELSPTEKLYRVPMDNGDVAFVQPLSPLAYQALLKEAARLFPDPDKEPYVKPLPHAFPGAPPIPAEENPEYIAALKKAVQKQMDWVYVAIIRSGVIVDTEEGKAATFERYKPKLTQLIALGGEIEQTARANPWLATVLFCIVTTRADIQHVGNAARENLTQEEIRVAIQAFFRPIQRNRLTGNSGNEVTPGAQGQAGKTASSAR